MRKLITATNSIEANLLLNLLHQAKLDARIDGEYLQGGIGEIQTFGAIRVMIREDHYAEGKEILDFFLNSEPVSDLDFNNGTDGALEC